jgi:hypothetical protein
VFARVSIIARSTRRHRCQPPTLFEARFLWFIWRSVDVDNLNPLDGAGTTDHRSEIEPALWLFVVRDGVDRSPRQRSVDDHVHREILPANTAHLVHDDVGRVGIAVHDAKLVDEDQPEHAARPEAHAGAVALTKYEIGRPGRIRRFPNAISETTIVVDARERFVDFIRKDISRL